MKKKIFPIFKNFKFIVKKNSWAIIQFKPKGFNSVSITITINLIDFIDLNSLEELRYNLTFKGKC